MAGLILLLLILLYPGWSQVFESIRQVPLTLFMVLALLQMITILLSSYIWYALLKREIPFIKVLTTYLTGSLLESITPAIKLGGEAVKVYLFSRLSSISYLDLMTILMAQKYISLLPFLLLSLLVLVPALFLYSLPPALYLSLLLLGLLFFIFFLPRERGHKREEKWSRLPGFLKTIASARKRWPSVMSCRERRELLLVSTSIWLLYPVKIFLVARSLAAITDPIHSTISTFSAYIISMIPLLPGGLGTFEGSLAFFFTLTGNPHTEGLAIALTARLITFYLPLIFSIFALLYILPKIHGHGLRLKPIQGGMNG